jgi:hypothetical protein
MRADLGVPAGAALARFELFVDDYPAGTDLDLFVYLNGARVGDSASGAVDEKVTLEAPEPGEYHVYVDLWSLAPGETESHVYLHSWAVEPDGVGDFTVLPESFDGEPGTPQDVVYSWTGLAGPPPGAAGPDVESPLVRRYLGLATYSAEEDVLESTMLRVDVGSGGPTSSPPTTSPPTTEPPTSSPPGTSPVPTTSLPGTGGGSAGLFAGLGLAGVLAGGLFIAIAARRLRRPA